MVLIISFCCLLFQTKSRSISIYPVNNLALFSAYQTIFYQISFMYMNRVMATTDPLPPLSNKIRKKANPILLQ